MNNLPIKTKKRNMNLFNRIIDSIKLSKANEEFIENISMFKNHPKFSAYKSDFVKFATYLLYESTPDLCVFFADGDGLRIANELAEKKAHEINIEHAKKLNLSDISLLENPITGEQLVDNDIESIVLQINSINQKYGYENALVGVQGDEFFISIPNIKQEDKEKIYNEYSNCQSGLITISVGYCDDMANGIENAFNKAEEQASKVKLEKKERNRKSIFKENNKEIFLKELKNMLSQLRIQVDTLTTEQKGVLKNNIRESFETSLRTPEGIFNDIKNILLSPSVDFSISDRINALDKDLENNYSCSISSEQRSNFILSSILTHTPVKNIQKLDYFIQKGADNLLSSSKEKTYKNLQKNNLVSIEISGIKNMNDIFGHSKCDEMIYETLNTISSVINDSNIKLNSPIFSHNISTYGFLVPENNSNTIDELIEKISSINSDFKLAVSYNRLGSNINKESSEFILNDSTKDSTDILELLLNSAYTTNKQANSRITSEKKINDKLSISRYISRNLKQITNSLGKNLDLELFDSSLNYILGIDTISKPERDNITNNTLEKSASDLSMQK